jgi:hypothetical protein
VYRGVRLGIGKNFTPGQKTTWWGVSSCTETAGVTQGFLGTEGKRTLFTIDAKAAVNIKPYSDIAQEDEVLLRPGTTLEVKSVVDFGGGMTMVQLEEITTKAKTIS